jgi:anti-sigma regulatory factor (Ser/Thr protein kinase)
MATADIENTSAALLDVTLPAEPECVPRARALLAALLAPIDRQRAGDIRLAVTEACANVAQHAYRSSDADRTVRLVARRSVTALLLIVEDRGCGLESRHSPRGSGLGLVLIRRLADDARIEDREGGGTLVLMTFRLASPEQL